MPPIPTVDEYRAYSTEASRSRLRGWIGRAAIGLALVLASALGVAMVSAWPGLGELPDDARRAALARSHVWRDGRFQNAQALWEDSFDIWKRQLFGRSVPDAIPDAAVSVRRASHGDYAAPPVSGLRVTWFGHSSALIEIDGVNVLVDPLWSGRPSPVDWAGPVRWYPPPIALRDLPRLDAVLISHDHYDHLDRATIIALEASNAKFIVPLGVGAHLEYWGIPRTRIVELDWWQSVRIREVSLIATPARHTSGRISLSSNQTLWAGYAVVGPRRRAWYSGDTGFHDDLARIGARYGPFDLTLIEAGQYDPLWPDNHLGPELAVEANRLVSGRVMMPVHWGLISLAPHGWTEPVERAVTAARCSGVALIAPRPGEMVEPTRPFPFKRWWPNGHWIPVGRKPVLATRNGYPSERVPTPSCLD